MAARRVEKPMERRVAEVVVRLADTIVTIAHVEPGASYRVGRIRGVDLPLDVATFYLVSSTPDGFAVRRTPGATAEPLEPDVPIDLAFGNVSITAKPDLSITTSPRRSASLRGPATPDLSITTSPRRSASLRGPATPDLSITISLTTLAGAPLARRKLERRPLIFGAVSTAAHLALLLLATYLAVPEDTSVAGAHEANARPMRVARFAAEAQTVKRLEQTPPPEIPITTDATPSAAPAVEPDVVEAGNSEASLDSPDGRGPTIVDRTIESRDVSGQDHDTGERRFDPDANPAFDSVKVGNYSTVATGHGGGEQYELAGANGNRKPLIVVSCDASTCLVIGGEAGSVIREQLEQHLTEIIACYQDHAGAAGKKVELDFGISAVGKVETDSLSVGGVGDYDSCVANIINKIQFGDGAPSTDT